MDINTQLSHFAIESPKKAHKLILKWAWATTSQACLELVTLMASSWKLTKSKWKRKQAANSKLQALFVLS